MARARAAADADDPVSIFVAQEVADRTHSTLSDDQLNMFGSVSPPSLHHNHDDVELLPLAPPVSEVKTMPNHHGVQKNISSDSIPGSRLSSAVSLYAENDQTQNVVPQRMKLHRTDSGGLVTSFGTAMDDLLAMGEQIHARRVEASSVLRQRSMPASFFAMSHSDDEEVGSLRPVRASNRNTSDLPRIAEMGLDHLGIPSGTITPVAGSMTPVGTRPRSSESYSYYSDNSGAGSEYQSENSENELEQKDKFPSRSRHIDGSSYGTFSFVMRDDSEDASVDAHDLMHIQSDLPSPSQLRMQTIKPQAWESTNASNELPNPTQLNMQTIAPQNLEALVPGMTMQPIFLHGKMPGLTPKGFAVQ